MNNFITSFNKASNVPITTVAQALVPSIQRVESHDVVADIVFEETEFFNNHGKYLIPGCLSIVILNGNEYIIDGQHRLTAYKMLNETYPERALHVSIDYYTVTNEEGLELVYQKVNRSTRNPIERLEISAYKVHNDVMKYFNTNYEKYMSNAKVPQAPRLSLRTLSDRIEKRLLKAVTWNGYQLIERIVELNKYYAAQTEGQMVRWGINTDHLNASKQFTPTLILSAYRNYEWIDRLIDIHNGTPMTDIPHLAYKPPNLRSTDGIVHSVRVAVWNKGGDPNDAVHKCHVCKEPIRQKDNFVCGHVVPRAHGGKCTLENLEPICIVCNRDMGTMNMLKYMQLREEQIGKK
jgi:hypothetical protein